MRTIKFRAWYSEDKVMIYDLNSPSLFHGELKDNDYLLMQFTGLHDRNENEIYESDIIQFAQIRSFHNDAGTLETKLEYIKSVVEFAEKKIVDCCENEYTIMGWSVNLDDLDHIEVIGNIFENPELMVDEE